jgi:hypothetical protein
MLFVFNFSLKYEQVKFGKDAIAIHMIRSLLKTKQEHKLHFRKYEVEIA